MIVYLLALLATFLVCCSSESECLEENKTGTAFKAHCVVNDIDFSNKDDYLHIRNISSILYTPASSNYDTVVLVVGLNQGSIVDVLTENRESLEGVTIHGFEIQNGLVKSCVQRFAKQSSTFIHRLGLSNVTKLVRIAGSGEVAGLYSHDAMSVYWKNLRKGTPWPKQVAEDKVRVTTLSKWTRVNGIGKVDYTTIDTEGHEVKVILGMTLEIEENKRKFSSFQLELGGTWDAGDPRRPVNEWDESQLMAYLTQLGYNLLFIGKQRYVLCDSLDFARLYKQANAGSALPGNLLAIHEKYARPDLLAHVKEHMYDQLWISPAQVIQASKQVVNLEWGNR